MRRIIILAFLCLLPLAAKAQSPSLYIFDVLNRPAYRAAYERMVHNERALPSWMATAEAATRATTTPGVTRRIDGTNREIFSFCQAHNCAGHTVVVMFTDFGESAKGLLSNDNHVRFFGNPSPAESRALLSTLSD
jgi:Inhibitor of vertebrate lysozyme (Ivy)